MPPFQQLLEHPILHNFVKALCGDAFSLDQPPSLVNGSETNGKLTFSAGDPESNRRLRYVSHGDVGVCNGLRVIVALAPSAEGGLVLVSASYSWSCVSSEAPVLHGRCGSWVADTLGRAGPLKTRLFHKVARSLRGLADALQSVGIVTSGC